MGKHILVAVFGSMLVLGASTVFGEEPQLTDQELLKAWGQALVKVEPISLSTTPKIRGRIASLTDESLESISAGMPGVNQFQLDIAKVIRLREENQISTQNLINRDLRLVPLGRKASIVHIRKANGLDGAPAPNPFGHFFNR